MNRKSIITIALLLVVAVGGFFLHKDYSYRQQHGQVTAVDLFSYDQEVDQVQGTKPVLIYFYRQEKNSPADEAQLKIVKDFAWKNAYDVKVVAVNTAHVENLPLALANGALRAPAFVFVSHDKHVNGQNGTRADYDELMRLLALVENQP
jgi:hypothetical protein